jgi:phage-related minor tail protein
VSLASGFFDISLGNILTLICTLVGILIAYEKLKGDDRRREEDHRLTRETEIRLQTEMHTENRGKFDILIAFHKSQQDINRLRDKQLAEMENQTARLEEIVKGQNRRLEMLEDRRKKERDGHS